MKVKIKMLGLAAAYLKEREFVELPQGITVEEMLSACEKRERRDLSLLKAATFSLTKNLPAGIQCCMTVMKSL